MDDLEGFSYPLFPLPPGALLMLLGDVPVFLLLAFLFLRHRALARQVGDEGRRALHARKARLYRAFLMGAACFTGGCFLIWLIGLVLPGAVAAGPVGGVIGIVGFLPYLVWLTPLVAVSTDWLLTRTG